MTTQRKHGTIARILTDKVFGFIHCPEDQRDYFFHQAQLLNCTFGQLEPGDAVSFVIGQGPKGKIEAQEIERDDRGHVPPVAARTPADQAPFPTSRRRR